MAETGGRGGFRVPEKWWRRQKVGGVGLARKVGSSTKDGVVCGRQIGEICLFAGEEYFARRRSLKAGNKIYVCVHR